MDWDRSRPWRVERNHVHRAHVRVRFASAQPTLAEIAAVRKAFPRFANLPPHEVRAQLVASGELDLGEVGAIEAGWLRRAATHAGLSAIVDKWVETRFTIIDEAGGIDESGHAVWLIEDENENRRTAEEMIAAGVKVVDVIAD
jgi:hypothetical protein